MPKLVYLNNKAVFLSASVPSKKRSEQYRRVENAATAIEEAVIAVARAVFSAGGRLVFGAHPSISPLVASVIGEYETHTSRPRDEKDPQSEREMRPRVEMYQSDVWKPYWAESSKRLAEHFFVQIEWTPIIGGETVSLDKTDGPQAPRSMTEMRKRMIEETAPVAMIIIGGMEGTEEEAKLFAEYREGAPIFALETTGGAASLIEQKREIRKSPIVVMDKQDHAEVMRFWNTQENRDPRIAENENAKEGATPAAFRERHYYVPYSFIAQQIVEKIAKQNG